MAIDIKEQFPNGDIIQLESSEQQFFSDILGGLINHARANEQTEQKLIQYIRGLWDGESWERILKKCDTEGSVWYVWWMDGVSAFIADSSRDSEEDEQLAGCNDDE